MAVSPVHSGFSTSVWTGELVEESDLGSIRRVTADTLPVLRGLSIVRSVLNVGVTQTPYWCTNASQLAYCVSGTVEVSVLDNSGRYSRFVITADSTFYIESGSLHYVENIGDVAAELVTACHSERPRSFVLGTALDGFSDRVLDNTYNLAPDDLAGIRRYASDRRMVMRVEEPTVRTVDDAGTGLARLHEQSVHGAVAVDPGSHDPRSHAHDHRRGSRGFPRDRFWPILKDMSMYSTPVEEEGLRGPHWHPVTAEMGYLRDGAARATIMKPDGGVDTIDLTAGDVYFVPPAHPHCVDRAGSVEGHTLTFFDRSAPPRSDTAYRPVPLQTTALPQRRRG